MSNVDELIRFLSDPGAIGARLTITGGVIGIVEQLATEFASSDASTRERITSCTRPEFSNVFFLYARHAAVQAVRNSDPKLISLGLISLAMENLKFDWRDSLYGMVMINNSAEHVSLDPNETFQTIRLIVSEPFGSFLDKFMRRPRERRSIALFGLAETVDPFDYVAMQNRTEQKVFRRWYQNFAFLSRKRSG
jgi:hypothetical protein